MFIHLLFNLKISFEKNSNGYLFSFEVIAQAVFHHIPIAQVPVQTRYTGEKRGASLGHCVRYSLGIFQTLLQFLLAKTGVTTRIFASPHVSSISSCASQSKN